ncbi:MAG TPA: S8 family serine peptidase [Angustibacter sp.]|nr:S8 family serine peptidase [Angustibacter sp.]
MDISPAWRTRRALAVERERTRADRTGGLGVERDADGYLYRPGQLLVGGAAVDELRSELGHDAVRSDDEVNHRFARRQVDVQKWLVRGDVHLPALQATLARRVAGSGSHVELNHVFAGEWYYEGGPATEPELADTLPIPQGLSLSSPSPAIAVLDTGVTRPAHAYFAPVLVDDDGTDVDELDEDGNSYLDTEAGHGTFICGLVQRLVPGLAMEQRKVLNANGFGDDLTVALGVAETSAPVLNLSLGGYTYRDRPPRALRAALAALGPDRVVVAAAGNNARTRAFWPAAFDRVIAVSAYDSATGAPAPFSNHGPWVDVCAPGVDLHSCFVDGRRSADPSDATFAGWAAWSGTSFAAPLVAAEIAHRVARSTSERPAADVAREFVEELGERPGDGYGRRFTPSSDLRIPATT